MIKEHSVKEHNYVFNLSFKYIYIIDINTTKK